MARKMRNTVIVLILSICQGTGMTGKPNGPAEVNETIEKLNGAANNLKNLTAQIEYIHVQSLFDTQTVRSGRLFYLKDANATSQSTPAPVNTVKDKSAISSKAATEDEMLRSTGSSALRINFLTMTQDDANEQNYREDYVFDGFKLTKIDYQCKSATTEQLAKDKAVSPLELVQDYFPIIGFVKPVELNRQFDIKLGPKQDKQSFVTLILTPKENCRFFKIYKQVEVKINSENFLPFDFLGLTSEDEKIAIKLSQIDISTPVKMSVFDIVIPADFTQTQRQGDRAVVP